MIAAGLLILALVVLYFMIAPSKPTIRIGLAHVSWLPAAASNINSYERSGFGWIRLYECQFPEVDFRAYAASNGWEMSSATNVSIPWRRALGLKPLRTIEGIGEMDIVANAWIHSNRRQNGGGITAVYDIDSQLLHVMTSHN
jgi:hypothetical protein